MDEERHQPRGGALLPRRGRMEQAGGQDLHLRRRRAEGYDGCPGQLRAAHHHDELLVRYRRRRQCDRGPERLERRCGHRTRLRRPAHGRKGEGSVGNRQTRPAARRDQHYRAALPFGLRGGRRGQDPLRTARRQCRGFHARRVGRSGVAFGAHPERICLGQVPDGADARPEPVPAGHHAAHLFE